MRNIIISLQNDSGYTPLIGACLTDQADIAKLLLEHKANVDYREKEVSSTLHAYNLTEAPVVVLSHWLVVSHRLDFQLYMRQVGMTT